MSKEEFGNSKLSNSASATHRMSIVGSYFVGGVGFRGLGVMGLGFRLS